jgi:hypothetical protein
MKAKGIFTLVILNFGIIFGCQKSPDIFWESAEIQYAFPERIIVVVEVEGKNREKVLQRAKIKAVEEASKKVSNSSDTSQSIEKKIKKIDDLIEGYKILSEENDARKVKMKISFSVSRKNLNNILTSENKK